MKNLNPEESFPIVDEQGKTVGEALRSVCHNGESKYLHPVVHLHLFNSSGELFLQKRAITKDIQPGRWDTSVGGHVNLGETVEEALVREAKEELGLYDFTIKFLGRYIWESLSERELVNSFLSTTDKMPEINTEEIEEGRYWSVEEIEKTIGKNIFTPNFEHEFRMLLNMAWNTIKRAK